MMSEVQVLMVGRQPSTIESVRGALSSLTGGRFRAVGTIARALKEAEAANAPHLILVHGVEDLDRAGLVAYLVDGGAGPRSIPVVVLSETYDVAEATEWFGLGVADYLSLADHIATLAPVIERLAMAPRPIAAAAAPPTPAVATRSSGSRAKVSNRVR